MRGPEDIIISDVAKLKMFVEEAFDRKSLSGTGDSQYYNVVIRGVWLKASIDRLVKAYQDLGWIVECNIYDNRSPVTTELKFYVSRNNKTM